MTDVRSLIQRCARDTSPRIQEQAAALRAAVDQMDAAFARRAEAHANEGAAYGRLQVLKLQSIEVCRRTGNRLAELYPNQQDRVRSCFRRVVRRPRATAPTEGETAPATGATATATAAEATPSGPTLVVTPAATALASGTPRLARVTDKARAPRTAPRGPPVSEARSPRPEARLPPAEPVPLSPLDAGPWFFTAESPAGRWSWEQAPRYQPAPYAVT